MRLVFCGVPWVGGTTPKRVRPRRFRGHGRPADKNFARTAGQTGGEMKQLALALSMGAVVLTAQTAPAQPLTVAGAPLDHMVCYKTTDPLKLPQPNSTDLLAQLQPEFTQKGCTLIKPIEFCVPATKINVNPAPPDPNIQGTPLKNDYICYLAKCRNQIPPPDKKVIDQFGLRVQGNYKLAKVCVPARKGPAGCPIGPIASGGPKCQGACPNRTDVCKTFTAGGVTTCDCVPKNQPCGGAPDAAGMCSGDCTTPGEECLLQQVVSSTGTVSVKCACGKRQDPVCSLDAATGACGGACPKATEKCVSNPLTGQCDCQPDQPPCRATATGTCGTTATPCLTSADCPKGVSCIPSAPTCDGACPLPGQTCQTDAATGKCSCNPPAGCSQDPTTGQCSGTCPTTGQVCVLDSTGHCGCSDPGCRSDNTTVPPTCGGPCPLQGQQCVLTASGACACDPPLPCGPNTATGLCGGTCPVDAAGVQLTCRNVNVPGTPPQCACQ